MNKPAIIFAGFSLPEYVQEARKLFPSETHRLICVYGREANSDKKTAYLKLFDEVYTLDKLSSQLADSIEAITCTQERDMETYIKVLRWANKIDDEQLVLWNKVINKRKFKETISSIEPTIVPKVTLLTDIDDSMASISFPSVIKPTNLMGSSFVSVIHSKEELAEYLSNLSRYESVVKKIGRMPELVVEEFISGPQYSMNVYINNEEVIEFCPLIRVAPAFEVGINDTYSAIQYNSKLSDDKMDLLHQAVGTIVKVFRLRGTSAHFDCILSSDGWKICEVGLRIGGNRQRLFSISHGFSHFRNDLLNRCDQQVDLGSYKNTVAIVQKAPQESLNKLTVSYQEPEGENISFHLDKLTSDLTDPRPVSQGGATVFRAFMWGENEEIVSTKARELYDSIVLKSI